MLEAKVDKEELCQFHIKDWETKGQKVLVDY